MTRVCIVWLICICLVGCSGDSGREVVIYVAVDRQVAEPVLRRFTTQTSIKVRAVYDSEAAKTTGLTTRLLAERNRPRSDVYWNNEIVQTLELVESGIVAPFVSKQSRTIPTHLKDSEGMWTAVSQRARVIVYNTELLRREEVPKTVEQLTAEAWRGRVAIANPQYGTTRTHMAALFASLGEAKAQAFLQRLLHNEVTIVEGNAMVRNLVAVGKTRDDVLLGLTDTDDVVSGQKDGMKIEMLYPDSEGIGTPVIASTVCMIKDGPNSENAKELIDFLLSMEVEEYLVEHGKGYFPIRSTTRVPTELIKSTILKPMAVTPAQMHSELQASTEWTRTHFH